MQAPEPATVLPEVPGWPRQRIDALLPSPASRRDADRARFWTDLNPPLDAARLPAVLQTDRPAQARRGGRLILLAAAALLLIGGAYATFWSDAPWEEVLLGVLGLPVLLAALGGAILWAVRGQPDTLRLELSLQRVRFGVPPRQWEEPLSAYAGLALRRCLISDPTRKRQGGFSAGERAAGMHRRVERWWIELVHENPGRTVVLWASEQPLDDGLERVDELAHVLGLPILTTSNRYWVADDESAQPQLKGSAARSRLTHKKPHAPHLHTAASQREAVHSARLSTMASSRGLVPRLMALLVMLPLAAGMGWLTWTVAEETLTVQQTWNAVEVTVLDKSGADTIRVAIIDAAGQEHELDATRTTDLKAFPIGERFAAYADPVQPQALRPATAASLWGGVGMLAFFTLAFLGVAGFLLRSSG